MIRNLKALGLALVAVFAMSAMAASTALAEDEGTFTADEYPAHIVAGPTVHEKETTFTHFEGIGEINITCNIEQYTGEISEAVHKLTLTPTYEECITGDRGVTVTLGTKAGPPHEQCDYTFYNASDTEEEVTTPNDWTVTADLDCPTGQQIEIHIYNKTLHTSGTFCTITIAPGNNKELEGVTATNQTAAGHIEVHGKVTVKTEVHGACSAGLTLKPNATLNITGVTAEGTDEAGEPLGIEIS